MSDNLLPSVYLAEGIAHIAPPCPTSELSDTRDNSSEKAVSKAAKTWYTHIDLGCLLYQAAPTSTSL